MSFSVPTRSTLSSALALGENIPSETTANKTGSRRVKNDAAGMAILSAKTTNPDFSPASHPIQEASHGGNYRLCEKKCRGEGSAAVTLRVESTGIDGRIP